VEAVPPSADTDAVVGEADTIGPEAAWVRTNAAVALPAVTLIWVLRAAPVLAAAVRTSAAPLVPVVRSKESHVASGEETVQDA
jgi:hypothetical protein